MTEKGKSTVLLEYSLKKLKLPTMLREYAALATVCQQDRSDYPTYFLRLTEREFLDREKRAAEQRTVMNSGRWISCGIRSGMAGG